MELSECYTNSERIRPYQEFKKEFANTKKKNLLNAINFAEKISKGELTFRQHSEFIKEGIKQCEEQMEKLDELKKEKITITIDTNDYVPEKGELLKFEDKKTNNEITDHEENENNINNGNNNYYESKNKKFLGNKRKNIESNNNVIINNSNNNYIKNIFSENYNNNLNYDDSNNKVDCVININEDINDNNNHFIICNDYRNDDNFSETKNNNNIDINRNNYQRKYFLGLRYSIEDFIFNKSRDFNPQDLENFFTEIYNIISKRKLNNNGFHVRNIIFYI